MSARYTVEAWVPPGVLVAESRDFPTFNEMMVEAGRIAAKYPHATLSFANVDRCDLDTNGLTDEENEALDMEFSDDRS